MAKVFSEKIITALDVGTTKICVLVARRKNTGEIEIVGTGKSPSHGLSKGVVVDINQAVDSIRAAVGEAEIIAGRTIDNVIVGVSGAHIKSFNSSGAVPIKSSQVRDVDIANAMSAARAIALSEGQEILHVLPQYFCIDGGQDRLVNPLGMSGVRLEVRAHIITGSVSSVQNLMTCCQLAGVRVADMVLEQLASANAVLSNDERDLGIGVLDIGGGTADFVVYQCASIRHTMVLPIAGNHFTHDLAVGLQTTLAEAERIKIHEYRSRNNGDSVIISTIHGDDLQEIQRSDIALIVQARARELLSLIRDEIKRHGLGSDMVAGLVLTGGGSLLDGMIDLSRQILGMPARLGAPRTGMKLPESLDSPIYSTGYGLLLHAFGDRNNRFVDMNQGSLHTRTLLRMKSWLSDFF